MKRTLLRLFAMSVALALQFGAAAQTIFHATVPSGQSLRFETTSPTTCQLAGNNSIGGSETDSLIIPYTVSDGTNTYQVTAIGTDGINGFLGRGTLMLPNSITRIEWHGITSNDFDTIIFPAGLNFMDNGAFQKSPRVGSASVLVFRSATPPATTSGYHFAFTNEYTSGAVQHIYVPAGQTAAYRAAFVPAFTNATLHEWGTSTPTVVDRHDTIHPGEVRWINNRPYDGTWVIRDSSLYYTQNLITRVFLQAVEWHFYADAPTGQRLYYRITGTDSVEVRAPNGSGWGYYTPPTDSLAIPATVTHDGHTYSVFRIYGRAFYRCDAITALTLSEGISEVGPDAIFIMTTRELRVSLPRSLRIIDDYAFNTYSFSSRLKLASDTIWAEVIGREAFFPKVISQPIVLPNVRSIGYKAFYRIESCPYLWVGDSCTSIGEQAFAETTTAPISPIPGRISLGTSLQTVGASAFSRPNGLPIHSVEFRGATVPSFADDVFGNTQVDSIITPCGTSSAYRTALYFSSPGRWDPSNTVFQERGCPVYAYLYDTLFYAMGPVTFAGRSITSPGEYRDTIHLPGYDSINILVVSEVYYSFYADAPTGQRLYYRIAGTDSVEVVAPNDYNWDGYTKPTDSLAIPATVSHAGHNYSVFRIADVAFTACDAITALTLSEGIAEVGASAFEYCEAMTHISLPRSLRTIGDAAFSGMSRFMSPRNLTLASDTIWAETIAVSAFTENIISQPIVLPNVRTIGFAAFANIYRCPYIFVGDSCTSIGANAFDNAFNALPGRISLGTSLQTVGNYALCQYATIRSVEFRGTTVPSFGEGIFYRNQVDSIITPCGTSAAYRTALDAAPVNNQWDASATLFAERGCQVLIDLYDAICAGGTYTFGGQTAVYPSAASVELYDTVRYALYDSITVMHLTVKQNTTGDTAAVAFDRFAWYGTTYTASGTPTHVLTNAAGCDSTVTLALTILEGYATDPTFGEQGIEVEAYGYCAGPGAVRYRLSSGQPDEYSLIFGHAAWTNIGWQRIATPGNIDITVPDGLPTGDYTATLYFRHSAYPDMVSAPIEVTIHVNLPETYVMPLFSDVIALVDTCHCLTDVQWYHREAGAADWEAIPGANDYYYHQEGGLTGEYFVSARYNGQPTYTCPQSDMTTLITEPQPTLTAYPNPTRDVVTLELLTPHSSLLTAQTHVLRVLNLQGVELERRVFEGSTLQLDLSAYQRGSYVVSVDGMVVRVIRN